MRERAAERWAAEDTRRKARQRAYRRAKAESINRRQRFRTYELGRDVRRVTKSVYTEPLFDDWTNPNPHLMVKPCPVCGAPSVWNACVMPRGLFHGV